MQTDAVHNRFWASMGERFGRRWLDEYGDKPTKAWRELIDRFTQDDVAAAFLALKDRSEANRAHPPTHAEFESMLERAAQRRRADSRDFQRDYWRSQVLAGVFSEGVRLGKWPRDSDRFEQVLVDHRDSLVVRLRELVEDLCASERRTGQRTPGQHELLRSRVAAIATAFCDAPRQASLS